MDYPKQITLTPEVLEELACHGEHGNFEKERDWIKGFEGFIVSAFPDTGEYDSSKSAMIDFDLEFSHKDDEYSVCYYATGGYYYQGGMNFSREITFTLEKPLTYKEQNFYNYIESLELDEEVGKAICEKFSEIY